ncbi:MAG: diguanylate cyclase, partial [Desulfatirhabdiaceae bacterium]
MTNTNFPEHKNPLSRQDCLSCMELGKVLTAELDPRRFLKKLIQKVSELLPAENWSLLLLDEETQTLRFEACVNLGVDAVKDVRLKVGEGIAGQAALQKQPVIETNVCENPLFCNRVDQISGMSTRSIIAVPLLFSGKCSGVIELVNPRVIDDRTIYLMSAIADYAAIAVENMRRYTQIHDLSIRDNLTGLFNTRYLYQTLTSLIAERKPTQSPLSLIFMDVDNFKQVVDTYGHLKGSQVLSELAGTIVECIQDPAFGVAYGGDEFVVVLPDLTKSA